MSYLLYINESLIELPSDAKIPQTKQVNDLARLDNRQSNFTHKFSIPPTSNNIKAMEAAYLVGNNSNIPYQKNECNLYDADSGACLIYKGWAVISKSSQKGYEVNVYDGIIDFYRKIENRSLTEVGISELNHAKNIDTIIASWANDLPYVYALSDYNGNNKFTPPSGVGVQVNSDFQVPSARVSFLWDKIFEFAGFTYSGSYFETQAFINLFMTFPKPVPVKTPFVVNQTEQNSIITEVEQEFPTEGGVFVGSIFYATLLPTDYDTYYSNNLSSYILIEQYGAYRITCVGSFENNFGVDGIVNWELRDAANNILQSGSIDGAISESIIISANPTNKLFLYPNISGQNSPSGYNSLTGSMVTTFDFVIGYDANFEEAFVDFKITDFVNEVMQEAGLTAFKDKYRNHIDFRTVNEILSSPDRIDWTKKFQYKNDETYKIGRYAKRNNFKYRYNSENENHNNGFITVEDENLPDAADVLTSKLYTPEKRQGSIYGKNVPIFKIWDKEVKDDFTVDYKELTGRFYFLRVTETTMYVRVASQSLNTEGNANVVLFANYSRLSFSKLIEDNYTTIARILNKGKIVDGYFDLKPKDIETFDFKKPIYVEQLASNYIVNKIVNFIKGKVTKCELLEVDYNPALDIIIVPDATYLRIDSYEIKGCDLDIVYSTDAPIGTIVRFTCKFNDFGVPNLGPVDPNLIEEIQIQTTANVGNVATFNMSTGFYYVSYLQIDTPALISNQIMFENTATCYVPIPPILISRLLITNVVKESAVGYWSQPFTISFDTDASFPVPVAIRVFKEAVTNPNHPYYPQPATWTEFNTNSQVATSGTVVWDTGIELYGLFTKFQLKIGDFESNIYEL